MKHRIVIKWQNFDFCADILVTVPLLMNIGEKKNTTYTIHCNDAPL